MIPHRWEERASDDLRKNFFRQTSDTGNVGRIRNSSSRALASGRVSNEFIAFEDFGHAVLSRRRSVSRACQEHTQRATRFSRTLCTSGLPSHEIQPPPGRLSQHLDPISFSRRNPRRIFSLSLSLFLRILRTKVAPQHPTRAWTHACARASAWADDQSERGSIGCSSDRRARHRDHAASSGSGPPWGKQRGTREPPLSFHFSLFGGVYRSARWTRDSSPAAPRETSPFGARPLAHPGPQRLGCCFRPPLVLPLSFPLSVRVARRYRKRVKPRCRASRTTTSSPVDERSCRVLDTVVSTTSAGVPFRSGVPRAVVAAARAASPHARGPHGNDYDPRSRASSIQRDER